MSSEDLEKTVVAGGASGEPVGGEALAAQVDDLDATVLAPMPDEGQEVGRQAADQAADPDATVLAPVPDDAREDAPDDPDATVLAPTAEADDPDATAMAPVPGADDAADPDATVLAPTPEAGDEDAAADPEATQLADAAPTRLVPTPATSRLESLPTIVLPEVTPADPDDVASVDGIDALDDPYFSPAVPEDLTEAHAPVQIDSPVQSLPERKKRMPRWAVVLLVLVLLGAAGGAAWYTYQQEYWGGRTVPQVVGLSEEDARTALGAAGFPVEVSYELADDNLGCVLACSLNAGDRVDTSTTATITVAAGRTIPQVVGQDKDTARQALLDAGATNVVFSYVSSDAADGTVVSVDPAEGQPFVSTDTITLSVAEPYVVPEVKGLTVDAAKAALEKAGLTAKVTYVESDQPHNTVVACSPDAGTQTSEGAEVELSVSSPYPSDPFYLAEYFDCTSPEAAAYLGEKGFSLSFGGTFSNGDANAAYTSQAGDVLTFTDKPEAPASGSGADDVLSGGATIGGVRLAFSASSVPEGGTAETEAGVRAVMAACGFSTLKDTCTQDDIVVPEAATGKHFICGYGEDGDYAWAVVIGGSDGLTQVVALVCPKNRFNGGVNLSSFGNSAADYIAYTSLF